MPEVFASSALSVSTPSTLASLWCSGMRASGGAEGEAVDEKLRKDETDGPAEEGQKEANSRRCPGTEIRPGQSLVRRRVALLKGLRKRSVLGSRLM